MLGARLIQFDDGTFVKRMSRFQCGVKQMLLFKERSRRIVKRFLKEKPELNKLVPDIMSSTT